MRGDNGDANDTNATIAEILKLRQQRAALLGFETHAHYRMADTMAKEPEKAMDLMMKVMACQSPWSRRRSRPGVTRLPTSSARIPTA